MFYYIAYFLFYWVWQGPQTFLGWLFSLGKTPAHTVLAGIEIYRVHWVWPGLCLGKYIFLNDITYGTMMFRHQVGHFLQSVKLGPLYILVIQIPALIWLCLSHGSSSYLIGYTEIWANELGMKRKK